MEVRVTEMLSEELFVRCVLVLADDGDYYIHTVTIQTLPADSFKNIKHIGKDQELAIAYYHREVLRHERRFNHG